MTRTVRVNGSNYIIEDDGEIGCHVALRALGRPYVWGGGSIVNADRLWPIGEATNFSDDVRGYDCSGFVIAALMQNKPTRDALLKQAGKAKDMSALDIANACVPVFELKPWDMVYYPRHIMLYIGNGLVVGATGGGATTHGNNPKALVTVERFNYRTDIVCGCRLKDT